MLTSGTVFAADKKDSKEVVQYPNATRKDPKQDYNPTEPVKEPEGIHEKVLTQA